MSTFTNWNGPGDVPGDLTIFYQRLLELEKLLKEFFGSTKPDKTMAEMGADWTAKFTAEQSKYTALATKVDALQTAWTAVKGPIEDLLTDIDIIKNFAFEDISADSLLIEGVAKFDKLDDWIQLMKKTAIRGLLVTNKIQTYDNISWRRHRDGADDLDYQADIFGDTNSPVSSCVAPVVNGEYVLAVIDAEDEVSNGDYAAGTIHFVVKDSLHMACTVDFAMALDGGTVYHGGLNVTYAVQQSGSRETGTFTEWFIRPTSSAAGGKQWFVTCKPPSTGGIGDTWFIGRNIRRYGFKSDGTKVDENGIDISHNIAYARSERGEPWGGSCHGVAISDLTTVDFSAFSGEFESTLDVWGKSQFDDDVTIDGNLTVKGTQKYTGGADITGDLTVSGKGTFGGDLKTAGDFNAVAGTFTGAVQGASLQSANGLTVVAGPINAITSDLDINNLKVRGTSNQAGEATFGKDVHIAGGSVDIGKMLTVTQDISGANVKVGANGVVTTDKLVSQAGDIYLEKKGAQVEVGNNASTLELWTNSERINVKTTVGDQKIAYMSDFASGVQFQSGVTVFKNSAGAPTFSQIQLETGLYYLFEPGDTCLVAGSPNSDGTSTTAIYTVQSVSVANGNTVIDWGAPAPVKAPAKQGDVYMTWNWMGFALQPDGKWGNSYIFWNPNTAPYWSIADLHMEGYRLASRQDQLDTSIAAVSTIQPDWLEDDPMLTFPDPVPPGVSDRVPNPAYIENKPWMGYTMFSGGDWDTGKDPVTGEPIDYRFIMNGGDFDAIMAGIAGSLPNNVNTYDQQNKSGIIKLASGKKATVPPPSQPTAMSLKYLTDTKQLVFDDGVTNWVVATLTTALS